MIRSVIRGFLHRFNYEVIRVNWKNPKKFKVASDKKDLDLYATPYGKYYLPNFLHHDCISKAIMCGDLFDENIIAVAKKYVKEGSCVLDLGANYGQMSIYLSSLVGPSGKIYSFEAEPFVYSTLKNNIEANNCQNVTAVFGAVHYQSNIELIFPEPDFKKFPSFGSYGLDMKAKEGRKVKTLTIDSLNITEKIDFMKVDIQGADLFALQGAKETILKNKMPIIFEFEQQFQDNFSTTFQDYVDFVDSINYKFAETIDNINFLILPK
jgi:FkbM family methyltransferase